MRVTGLILLAVGLVAGVVGLGGTFLELTATTGAGLLVVFLVLVVIGVAMLVAGIAFMRCGPPIGVVPSPVNGKVGAYEWNAPSNQELDDSPYTVHYTAPVKGRNGQPSSLKISTPVSARGELQVTRETWFDKICTRFRLAVEIQTGDADFDSVCYVRSDTPPFAAAYLSDTVKRVAILDMRRLGFPEVTLKAGSVSATWTGFDPLRDDRPDLTVDVAARLILLARNLPAHQPEFEQRTGTRRANWEVAFWVFLVAFAITLSSLAAFPPLVTSDLVWRISPAIGIGMFTFACVSAWCLHGTSTSHYSWARLVLASLLLFPLGCVGIGALLNGALDRSPGITQTEVVVRKYTHKPRRSSTVMYHVVCTSWRAPGETLSFEISAQEYAAVVVEQSQMVVTTRAGALGIPWRTGNRLELQPLHRDRPSRSDSRD